MRKDDVAALLQHADSQLSGTSFRNIEQQYEAALSSKTISSTLQIDVKNYMENLRSALDYMAKDIYDSAIRPNRVRDGKVVKDEVYFPYGKNKNDFKSGLGSNLPDLQTLNPKIYEAITALQPHVAGNDWLYQLCRIVNEKKHDTLTPQTRTESQTMTASAGGASITIPINNPNVKIEQGPGATVTIGGVPVKLSNRGIEPLGPGLQRTVTTWVSFHFAGTDTEVLPLLKRALTEIRTLSEIVYSEIK